MWHLFCLVARHGHEIWERAMQVAIELIAARILGEDIAYVVHNAPCGRATDPDTRVRAELAVHFPTLWLRRAIVRPAGWRYEDARVVLTYLAYSDELTTAQLPLRIPILAVENVRTGIAGVTARAMRELARSAHEEPQRFQRVLRASTLAALGDLIAQHDGARARAAG